MNITVSVDGKGNLQCSEPSVADGSTIAWVPDGTTISSIASVSAKSGSFSQAPSSSNRWNAILGTSVDLGNGIFGWEYNISANPTGGGAAKQKAPKIFLQTTNEHSHVH